MTEDQRAATASMNMALTCPKCQSAMRAYERSGITVDQCTGCRGIFLDRGELERLIDAEDGHYGTGTPGPSGTGRSPQPGGPYATPSSDDTGYDRGGHGSKHGGGSKHGDGQDGSSRRKRGGFLGDLLDFG